MTISKMMPDSDIYKYKKVSTIKLFGKRYDVIHEKNNVVNNPLRIYFGLCLSTIESLFTFILKMWKKKYIKIGVILSIATLAFTIVIHFIIANEQLRYRANICMDVTHKDCESLVLANCENEVIDFIMSQNTTLRSTSAFNKLKNCIKSADPKWFYINFTELLMLFANICVGSMLSVIVTVCLINIGQFMLNSVLLLICKYRKCTTYEIPEVKASSMV